MHKSSVYNDELPKWIHPCKQYKKTENHLGRRLLEEVKEGRSF